MKTLDVYDVTLLEKKEWKEMSPGWGNVLCNMWKEHQKTIADGPVEYHKGILYVMDSTFQNLPTAVG